MTHGTITVVEHDHSHFAFDSDGTLVGEYGRAKAMRALGEFQGRLIALMGGEDQARSVTLVTWLRG